MYERYDDNTWGKLLGCIALFIFLCFVMTACNDMSVDAKRERANMVYIEEGYCYDRNTKIIYKETIVEGGRYSFDTPTYTAYVNENGNYCKYEFRKWVEIDRGAK